MTDITGKSHEWLAGYHAAMTEIAQECSKGVAEMDSAHASAPTTVFGNPTPEHHRLSGASKAMTELCQFAFEKGNEAFAKRHHQ